MPKHLLFVFIQVRFPDAALNFIKIASGKQEEASSQFSCRSCRYSFRCLPNSNSTGAIEEMTRRWNGKKVNKLSFQILSKSHTHCKWMNLMMKFKPFRVPFRRVLSRCSKFFQEHVSLELQKYRNTYQNARMKL